MASKSFHTELPRLRELADRFAVANPALAPLLNGPMADPDVERLLDAVVFQNDLLSRKLSADFPELIRNLTHLVLPHYLRPVPASTIIGFTPAPAMGRSVMIPAGARIASIPVDGTCCQFRTACDLEIHPVDLVAAAVTQTSARAAEIRLSFQLQGVTLRQWRPGSVRLFLAGDRVTAGKLYKLLCQNLKRIVLSAPGTAGVNLPPGCLKPAGYDEFDILAPYPSHAFPGYRLLQEYFNAPERFLFFELSGFDRWRERGEGGQFTVSLQLDGLASELPKFGQANFVPNAVPAVNLFAHASDPISLDHRQSRYLIRPCGPDPDHHRIYSVDSVTGFTRSSGQERSYGAFELFGSGNPHDPVYNAGLEKSAVRDGYDAYISVAFPGGTELPHGETLSIELTCTNGKLPENLRIGDIRAAGTGIPAGVACRNITPVNPGLPPPLGKELLWRLTTHLHLNHATLGSAGHLCTLLKLYLFQDNGAGGHMAANAKRIAGIEEVTVTPGETAVAGVPVRGSHIRLKIRRDHFAGSGDLYLFGCVLDRFLAAYSALNCYTRLTIDEPLKGEAYHWPLRQE